MDIRTHLQHDALRFETRRYFLRNCSTGLGAMWLASQSAGSDVQASDGSSHQGQPHFEPRAKRVIFLHMAGAPSTLEMFDYKPALAKLDGKDCPASFLEGKRFAFIQGVPRMLGPQFPFH